MMLANAMRDQQKREKEREQAKRNKERAANNRALAAEAERAAAERRAAAEAAQRKAKANTAPKPTPPSVATPDSMLLSLLVSIAGVRWGGPEGVGIGWRGVLGVVVAKRKSKKGLAQARGASKAKTKFKAQLKQEVPEPPSARVLATSSSLHYLCVLCPMISIQPVRRTAEYTHGSMTPALPHQCFVCSNSGHTG